MGILRNSINISGIASEKELPKQINGQLIEFSESDYIYMPEIWPEISSIHKIDVKLEVKEGRSIDAPTGRIIVLDGTRKVNITYLPAAFYQGHLSVNLELPFNTFIDLPNNAGEVKSINAFIVDAYFKLVNSRKIYNHMVYMIDVNYPVIGARSSVDTTVNVRTSNPEVYVEGDIIFTDE